MEKSTRLVYLCGPIDAVSREDALGWRGEAANRLEFHGFDSYNPAAAFRSGGNADLAFTIDCVNREALRASIAVIAHIEEGQQTIGTWREIEYAIAGGRPVFLIAKHWDGGNAPFSLYDVSLQASVGDAVLALRTWHNRLIGATTNEAPVEFITADQLQRQERTSRLDQYLSLMNPAPTALEIFTWLRTDRQMYGDVVEPQLQSAQGLARP